MIIAFPFFIYADVHFLFKLPIFAKNISDANICFSEFGNSINMIKKILILFMCFFIHSLCYCQEDAERLRKDMKAIHKQFGFKIDSCAQNAYDNTDLEKLIFPLYSSNERKVYKFYIQVKNLAFCTLYK